MGKRSRYGWWLIPLCAFFLCSALGQCASASESGFPHPLRAYAEASNASLVDILVSRVRVDPFNLLATLLFFGAIIHTFLAPMFLRLAHRLERKHRSRMERENREEVSFWAESFHFLGEVEAVFGIWVIPLLFAISFYKGWPTARDYVGHSVNFTEALFVVVIMTMAASRPIVKLSEQVLALAAALGKGSPAAWWLSILTLGPILGSFITEPAAMTISALLLGRKFYELKPRPGFAYATLGLLFVNVSVGGTLTHFAAPPVLMVAGKWGWGLHDMLLNFGWKAILGIAIANAIYFLIFRHEFRTLAATSKSKALHPETEICPVWITLVHLLFLGWTVFNNHYPTLFIGGFLFYLAFTQATEHHQGELALRPALLVGFFLAGLVVHGGLQGWWIEPLLTRFTEVPLFFGATFLTAFNDNAAITYLASLVPNFSDSLKYIVVAGAVVGGGLTVIANAPNPAGQSLLSKFFPDGVSALRLFLGALLPTIVMAVVFLLFR